MCTYVCLGSRQYMVEACAYSCHQCCLGIGRGSHGPGKLGKVRELVWSARSHGILLMIREN